MKKIPAFLAALFVTLMMGFVMLGIGATAYLNTRNVPIQNTAGSASMVTNAPITAVSLVQGAQNQAGSTQTQLDAYIAQLNLAIQRINDANTQIQILQSQMNQANTQLSDASATIQTYQNTLLQLQQRGLISIGNDGSITIRGRRSN